MRRTFLFAVSVLTIIGAAASVIHANADMIRLSVQDHGKHRTGKSLVLYRVPKAEKADDLSGLETLMHSSRSINLHKIPRDLGIVLMNAAKPYSDTAAFSGCVHPLTRFYLEALEENNAIVICGE